MANELGDNESSSSKLDPGDQDDNNTETTQKGATIRTRQQHARSRSRSELLARRKELLTTGQLIGSVGSTTNTNTNTDTNTPEDSSILGALRNNKQQDDSSGSVSRSSRSQKRNNINVSSKAEAKLESLSEQLKLHQESSMNSMVMMMNSTSPVSSDDTGTLPSAKNGTIDDVYILLAKKDKDLQLAAELGKVLLEKNDELSKLNEQQAEEFSFRLERLEEEKHKLRRQVELLEGEYENRLIEAQTDSRLLEGQLERARDEAKRREREKSRLIDDLNQQNQRLANELAEATRSEALLSSQVDQLNERLASRGSQRQDQDLQVEALKSEIEIVSQRKQDLERRLRTGQEERSQLGSALQESAERLLVLESLLAERDSRLVEVDAELNELRDASSWLSSQLESMISLNEKLASSDRSNASQLFGASDPFTNEELDVISRRSALVEQLRELRSRTLARTRASEMKLLRDKKQRPTSRISKSAAASHKASDRISRLKHLPSSNDVSTEDDGDNDEDEDDQDNNSRNGNSQDKKNQVVRALNDNNANLIQSIYEMLREFQSHLESRRAKLEWRQKQLLNNNSNATSSTSSNSNNSTSSSQPHSQISNNLNLNLNQTAFSSQGADDSGISAYDDSSSNAGIHMNNDNKLDNELSSSSSQAPSLSLPQDESGWQMMLMDIRKLVEDLPCNTCHVIINERQKYEKLDRDYHSIVDQLRKCEDQRLALSASKTELEAKVAALEDQCANLKSDLETGGKTPDEIVRLAWQRRDEAVARKNACEIALAKSRIENMQLSSQLMEVVHQKSKLAQQVAQFEDDMHYMTQDSVKAKFTWEEQAERLRRDQREPATPMMAGLSLGPLSSLLTTFSGSASNSNANNGSSSRPASGSSQGSQRSNQNAKQAQNDGVKPDTEPRTNSIMRQFASNSKLRLSRFWSANSNSRTQQTSSQ